ncbi:MAG: SAM-dependent chlorinase/fluorinase [Gemmatimonadetes bacterium]|nr:SAM-dependent chlorinase/fluorinase [Gemmatimonadota bacterium]
MDSNLPPEKPRALALLTDFGLADAFVGEMKGVIHGIAPDARVIDLAHGVRAGAVREGAWVLSRAFDAFPPGTVFCAVVDPGVGGDRRGLVLEAGGYHFVGPDNGLLAAAAERAAAGREIRAVEIALRELDRRRRGTTFDGRDLFAPTAARLAAGLALAQVGPELEDWISLAPFRPEAVGADWEVEIVTSDRFGNLVTVAAEAFLRETFGEDWRGIRVRAGGREIEGVRFAYEEAAEGDLLLSIGGGGSLEISANRGSARKLLRIGPGDRVLLRPPAA